MVGLWSIGMIVSGAGGRYRFEDPAKYAIGQGVPLDYVLAYMWITLAAAQGAEEAQINKDLAASKMTPAQIAEAQRMAREWMAKHQQ